MSLLHDNLRQMFLSERPKFDPRSLVRLDEKEKMIIFRGSNFMFGHLNVTATKIFCMCNGRNSVADIFVMLKNTYPDQDGENLLFDLVMTLRKLRGRRLLLPTT